MIDTKARNKIIKLWEQGESKASIGRKTGKSQPTIRKVIKKAELEKIQNDTTMSVDDEILEDQLAKLELRINRLEKFNVLSLENQTCTQPEISFIVNLTRNWPYCDYTPLQILKNGLPHWELRCILDQIFPKSTTNLIASEIERLGANGIHHVRVIDYLTNTIHHCSNNSVK